MQAYEVATSSLGRTWGAKEFTQALLSNDQFYLKRPHAVRKISEQTMKQKYNFFICNNTGFLSIEDKFCSPSDSCTLELVHILPASKSSKGRVNIKFKSTPLF